MESENESSKDVTVRDLQASLFPPTPKTATSFFSNFYLKTNFDDDLTDDGLRREPSQRELFSLSRESNFVPQPPRWPTECQVLEDKVTHIPYLPPTPEPYYVPTGKEPQPKPTGEECGIIVYQYTPISAVNYFSRSSVGGSRYLLPACLCPEEDCLRFESRFESGNLARAIRITPNFYELYLRADMYTNRHMQWFYFRITNMRKNFLYRFSIVNFSKEDSLYNEGMQPLMYSTKDSQLHSIGWRRCGDNVTYYCNDNVSPEEPEAQMTYTLSFTMEFPHEDDIVYLAHCYPYTYSDLEDYLTELSNHPIKSSFTTIRLLCKSLAGNNVHYITITSPPVPNESKKKRSVVLTARVHPGETPSSWMMKGFLDYLTSDCAVAKELRDKFIFKIVPMLNPDGVIVGNNRCSLSAKDLNRQYRTVMRDAYPSIWYTKLMVRRLLEECGVAMYCDLHAHSRKHNIFIYGCENRRGAERKLQEQVFPLMLHKNTADKFSFESCKFRIQKAKEGTGRVVMWMMGIANSYTMESSFAGSILGTRAETHFTTQDYEQMAKSFCQTLLDFYDDDPRKDKLRNKILNRLMKEGSNADEPTNIQLSDYSSDEGDTSSSSSNEVGRTDDELFIPAVPPPSPIVYKKFKPKVHRAKIKLLNRSPNATRKPLPICKATLGLYLSEKEARYTSDSSSSDDEEHFKIEKAKSKHVRRRPKKKKGTVKKKPPVCALSDCEIQYKANTVRSSISVFDLVPTEKIRSQNTTKRSKTPQPRVEKKNAITQQLSEVQAKLVSLKNKLWYGLGDNENQPLSWGRSQFSFPTTSPPPVKFCHKKHRKKSGCKTDKPPDKKNESNSKPKVEIKKTSTGLRRQAAVEWGRCCEQIQKSKSFPDNTLSKVVDAKAKLSVYSCDEEGKADVKKKKKKKTKFGKKAKTVSHAKIFFTKD